MSETLTLSAGTATPPLRAAKVQRLAWLDGLRGFAAAVVALFHLSPHVIGTERHLLIYNYFDLGKYGVLLFFLVSGYVIPMSMERHGSLRKFWIGRLFRIYPAFLFTIAAILVLIATGMMQSLNPRMQSETTAAVLGQATMLQDFVGVGGLITVFWTLSFEMAFYLVVAGLFAWNLHRLSAWWAAGLALLAVVGGTHLPDNLLSGAFNHRRVLAALLLVLLAVSLYAYIAGRRVLVLAAGVAGICLVGLPMVNGRATDTVIASASWQAVLMLAVMFAGTVIYRLQHGQIDRLAGIASLTIVFLSSVFSNWLHTGQRESLIRWTAVSAAIAATFAISFALRHRHVPPFLTWLGAISFSLYLTHTVVLNIVFRIVPADVAHARAGWLVIGAAFIALSLATAWFAYRFVELPGQAAGRYLQRRAEAILGPEEPLRARTSVASAGITPAP